MAIQEVETRETEFEKGFKSVGQENQSEPAAEKLEEKPDEKSVEAKGEKPDEKAEDEKSEKKAEAGDKPDEKEKAEVDELSKIFSAEDDNSETYKARWETSKGLIRKEKQEKEELAKELARLKAQPKIDEKTVKEESSEIDDLENQYMDALLDGDKETAMKMRRQVNALLAEQFKQTRETIKKEATEEFSRVYASEKMTDEVNRFVADTSAKYPFLDHTNKKTANPLAIKLVRATRDEKIEEGIDFLSALKEAVSEIAPLVEKSLKKEVTKEENAIDEDKIKSTLAVKSKSTPVKLGGKPKDMDTFEEGFNSFKVKFT